MKFMATTNTSEYSEEEKRQLREKWDNRLENTQHRRFNRKPRRQSGNGCGQARCHMETPRQAARDIVPCRF
jgi:hypothetical protein